MSQTTKKTLKPVCLAIVRLRPNESRALASVESHLFPTWWAKPHKLHVYSVFGKDTNKTVQSVHSVHWLPLIIYSSMSLAIHSAFQSASSRLAAWQSEVVEVMILRPWLQRFEILANPTLVDRNPHESNFKEGDCDRKMHSHQKSNLPYPTNYPAGDNTSISVSHARETKGTPLGFESRLCGPEPILNHSATQTCCKCEKIATYNHGLGLERGTENQKDNAQHPPTCSIRTNKPSPKTPQITPNPSRSSKKPSETSVSGNSAAST